MYIIHLLKRRDASSIIVAIVIGLSLAQLVSTIGVHINSFLDTTINLSFTSALQKFSWQDGLLSPVVVFVIHIIMLELVLQITLRLKRLLSKAFDKS